MDWEYGDALPIILQDQGLSGTDPEVTEGWGRVNQEAPKAGDRDAMWLTINTTVTIISGIE
jgi:hypothetical protein